MVIDYDARATPLATVRNQIISGYANGYWDGPGINSSSAATNAGYALGYAESAAVFTSFPALFAGQEVDDTSLLIRYTRAGDANLDGTVSLEDFNRLSLNFGQSGKLWSDGDFNYDQNIDLFDFNLLAANFGLLSLTIGPTPHDWAALAAAVPEPGALGFGLAILLTLSGARRRRQPDAVAV
jgi:hypothetical protein